MTSTAIIYSTSIGKHVEAAAKYLAQQSGADTFNLKDQTRIDISRYDRIVLGTGVHAGKPYKPLMSWAEANKEALAGKQTVLFICCLYKGERAKAELDKIKASMPVEFGKDDFSAFFPDKDEQKDGVGISMAAFAEKLRS
ncbi:hypothetical protein O8W32_00865 [Methanomassiliicoccales archaeon LGM-DZ1]|nr:hypothetical protein O8W32_00865 [Methanomassiliicoccales archaeon LGM-DZ1]